MSTQFTNTLYPQPLTSAPVQTRVNIYHAECARIPEGTQWAERKRQERGLRQFLGLSRQDLLAVEFGTVCDTTPCPDWFTPALLSEAERRAALTPDTPIAQDCGHVTLCPIHHREYTIVTGDRNNDCDGCFQEKARREIHAHASMMARQISLERSGVEEPVTTFAQQQQRDRTAWKGMLLLCTFLGCALLLMVAWVSGWLPVGRR